MSKEVDILDKVKHVRYSQVSNKGAGLNNSYGGNFDLLFKNQQRGWNIFLKLISV